MPELPDITVYIEHLKKLILKERLQKVTVVNPFFVRTFDPALSAIFSQVITNIHRIGKRIVFVDCQPTVLDLERLALLIVCDDREGRATRSDIESLCR